MCQTNAATACREREAKLRYSCSSRSRTEILLASVLALGLIQAHREGNPDPMTPNTTTATVHKFANDIDRQRANVQMSHRLNADEAQHTYQMLDRHNDDIRILQEAITNMQAQMNNIATKHKHSQWTHPHLNHYNLRIQTKTRKTASTNEQYCH